MDSRDCESELQGQPVAIGSKEGYDLSSVDDCRKCVWRSSFEREGNFREKVVL